MSSISCVYPISIYLLKTYSRFKSAQIRKITECTGVRENRLSNCGTGFSGILYCHQKVCGMVQFLQEPAKEISLFWNLPGACCDGIWSPQQPMHRLWVPEGVPIICCPSLWCRKVSSCIRENLESRGVGTIHSRLVHPCCTQCKVSTVGHRWPQNLLFTTTVPPQGKWYFAVQRLLLGLQQGLCENVSRHCLLLNPFIKRTRGMQVGEQGHVWVINPFTCRGGGPAFGSVKPDAKQNVALLIFPADRPGRTLPSRCHRDFPVPGIALGRRQGRAGMSQPPRHLPDHAPALPPPAAHGSGSKPVPNAWQSGTGSRVQSPRGPGRKAESQGPGAGTESGGDSSVGCFFCENGTPCVKIKNTD